MSAVASVVNGVASAAAKLPLKDQPAKKSRRRHTPGGATLGKDASREAQKMAAAILEVLAGARTPTQAAEALGVSLPRYFQLETRAMRALVVSCEARPPGRMRSVDKELLALRRQHERVQRELTRQQTLVRLAQRSLGLAPARGAPGVSTKVGASNGSAAKASGGSQPSGSRAKKRRRRRPVVRALRAAEQLQEQSQDAPAEAPAAGVTME